MEKKLQQKHFFLFLVCCFFSQFLFSAATYREAINRNGLVYRYATQDDVESILQLYEDLTTIDTEQNKNDVQRLLIFPMPFREDFLRENIKEKRIFVAVKQPLYRTRKARPQVVSLLKMFVVKEEAERNSILGKELRTIRSQKKPIAYSKGYLRINLNSIYEFNQAPQFRADINGDLMYRYSSKHSLIYFGNAYTVFEHRNQGISTELEKFALASIKHEILEDIVVRKSLFLDFIYGIVTENIESKVHIRCFSDFAHYIRNVLQIPAIVDRATKDIIIKLSSFMFHAFKPCFTTSMTKYSKRITLKQLPDTDENAGFGCILSAHLEGANYNYEIESEEED